MVSCVRIGIINLTGATNLQSIGDYFAADCLSLRSIIIPITTTPFMVGVGFPHKLAASSSSFVVSSAG
jgi:hypothetical protein